MTMPMDPDEAKVKIDPIDVRVVGGEATKESAADFGSWQSFNILASNAQGPQQILPIDRNRSKARILVQAGNGNTIPAPTVNPITLAASGVAAYNNNSVGVNVTVAGGTVSAIAVNGTSTGATSGTFFVPAGGTITVTYTVAPTTFTTVGIATSGTPSNAYVLLGSRGQVQNNKGGTLLVGNTITVESSQEVWLTGDGTNAMTVTVLAERYAAE